jgi:hypothetical protein
MVRLIPFTTRIHPSCNAISILTTSSRRACHYKMVWLHSRYGRGRSVVHIFKGWLHSLYGLGRSVLFDRRLSDTNTPTLQEQGWVIRSHGHGSSARQVLPWHLSPLFDARRYVTYHSNLISSARNAETTFASAETLQTFVSSHDKSYTYLFHLTDWTTYRRMC